MRPLPRRTTSFMPKRASNCPESAMSSRNFMAVRRRSPAGRGPGRGPPGAAACASTAAQLPVALNTASGMLRLSLFRRHSRTPPSRATAPAPRLTASISSRPSFLPRSSKSSTTTSSAGRLSGCCSSRVSTCVGGRRGDRQPRQPGIQPAGTRAGGLAVFDIAVEFVGVDVAAPELALARAADHHVMQGAAFQREFLGAHRDAPWAGSPMATLPAAGAGDGAARRRQPRLRRRHGRAPLPRRRR